MALFVLLVQYVTSYTFVINTLTVT